MKSKVTKLVTNRESISQTIENAIEHHGPSSVDSLIPILFPDGVPENFDLSIFLEALGLALNRTTTTMRNAEIKLIAEIADDSPPRDDRDASSIELQTELQDLQDLMGASYGPEILSQYGLDAPIPDKKAPLYTLADSVADVLRKKPITAQLKRNRQAIDAIAFADTLEQMSEDLKKALKAVGREEKEYQLALEARDNTVDNWSRAYRSIAAITSGLFDLAGRDDLAARVRPTAKRRAGKPEEADLEEKNPDETEEENKIS